MVSVVLQSQTLQVFPDSSLLSAQVNGKGPLAGHKAIRYKPQPREGRAAQSSGEGQGQDTGPATQPA